MTGTEGLTADDGDIGGLCNGHNRLTCKTKQDLPQPRLPDSSWLAKARLCCLRPHLLDARDNKVAHALKRKATMGGDLTPRERQQLNAIFARLGGANG